MKKLNNFGIAHLLIPVIAVVAIAAIGGVYMLVSSSAASKPCVQRTIGSGSNGGCTKYAQIVLNDLPSSWNVPKVKADGQYGGKTKSAVAKFQDQIQLNKDGVIGKETWFAVCKASLSYSPNGKSSTPYKKLGCKYLGKGW